MLITGCGARLIITPNSVAVLQGTEVTLKCSSESSKTLLWRISWNASVEPKTIYTGNKVALEFSSLYRIFTVKSGEVNLIMIATEATAKTYFCEEHGSIAANANAELIVLGEH